jgi:hypothetical protein
MVLFFLLTLAKKNIIISFPSSQERILSSYGTKHLDPNSISCPSKITSLSKVIIFPLSFHTTKVVRDMARLESRCVSIHAAGVF